uniref:Uncharacterized protein n=1 Tax=Lepeophtheirus salmonis TaxID=72036 RepID=A0A0K2TED7_LEPSM
MNLRKEMQLCDLFNLVDSNSRYGGEIRGYPPSSDKSYDS